MASSITSFVSFFERDIELFIHEMQELPEEKLWEIPDGVTNSAGVLAQHITGNLNHFIGHGLGATGYIRQRDREFARSNKNIAEMVEDLNETKIMVAEVLSRLTNTDLEQPFPIEIPFELNTFGMLLQLHHHLSYHLGQLNYLRRIIT